MNRASRYLANVTFLAFVRVVIVAFCVCICHQAQVSDGKVFERCELAQVLRYGHGLDVNDVANWVCIAQHSSSLNTSAFGGNARSGGSHGLFQISDQYWCSPPGKGVACGVSCDRLRDDDISDDLACVQIIYQEHQRLSGDGYNAWIAYESFCLDNPYEYVEDCFGNEEREYLHSKSVAANVVDDGEEEDDSVVYSRKRGKVYGRCELAKELFLKHKMPMEEIPTWVCIAQHESNYDTSAVGRLNADGSADHGLFQISDLYWCHHKGGRRKACGLPCSKLLDADITDDVKCVKQIYKEHTRISGDGFTAWTVYNAYCTGKTAAYVRGCFDGIDVEQPKASEEYRKISSPARLKSQKPHGKVYEPCELAEELRTKHHIPEDQIATWVCIAKHESDYNTSAIGYGDHGLFQISDIYWCSPPGKGWACGLSCADLEDSDITDDVECIRKIYREHTRLSGDGFKAWTVYPRFCSQGRSAKYIAHCPGQHHPQATIAAQSQAYTRIISPNSIAEYEPKRGKVYGRCELAKELLEKHDMDMEEIPTWVCIAHHESNFDTSAVGRLNVDGSADHGLFQISDLFWCSHKEGHRKACGLPCSKLLDNDISDDVRCVKQIHEEHTRISGDGFTAWSVYNPYCREQTEQYIRGCFDGSAVEDDYSPQQSVLSSGYVAKNKPKGKVYEECELATELRDKHHVPRDQIATWVCIAQHQSGLNTSSAVSDVHGLFHISDEYWCSPPGKGKSCELNCADLEDSDITDDVECIQKIYEEHQRLFGDGFNAWVVYPQHCNHGRANEYIGHCPGFKSTTANTISYGSQQGVIKTHPKLGGRVIEVSKNLPVYSHEFRANPFLKHFEVVNSNVIAPTFTQPAADKPTFNHVFNANPFLKHFDTISGNVIAPSHTQPTTNRPTYSHEFNVNPFLRHYDTKGSGPSSSFFATSDKLSVSASEEVIDSVAATKQQPAVNSFSLNPFLRTISTGFVATTTSTPAPAFSGFSIRPTPTRSKTIGVNSYQPQNEEKAKNDAFKSLAAPYLPLNTQTPRANRLQTYSLNTFKSPALTPTVTTTAPATTHVPWYQLNTLNSAKPIIKVESSSGYVFNKDSSLTSVSTAKPQFDSGAYINRVVVPSSQTTTKKPFTVVSFSTVKPPGTSFNLAAISPVQTSSSRSFSGISITTTAPPRTGGASFNRGVFPSTQTTTLRPVTGLKASGTSLSTTKPAFLSTTAKPQSFSGFSLNRGTGSIFQTSTIRPSSAASYTTKASQTSSKEDSGRYDPGRYDPGRYDSGRYDSGRYDSGRYDSGKYNQQALSRPSPSPVTTARTTVSSFGHYPTPTTILYPREQTTNRISITTLKPLKPSASGTTFSHPTAQPHTSRFLSKFISSEEDGLTSIFTTQSPQASSSNVAAQTLGSFSISNPIPGVKITNSGNVGISIHKSEEYLPDSTGTSPFQVDNTAISFLPSSSQAYINPSFTSKRDTDVLETLKSSADASETLISSADASETLRSSPDASETVKSSADASETLRSSAEASEIFTSSAVASETFTSSADASETLTNSADPSDNLRSSETFQDSSPSESTDSSESAISSTNTKTEETSSVTDPKTSSSVISTSVNPEQIQSSSLTTNEEPVSSSSREPEVLPEASAEQELTSLQSSKTESVKQPSSITLKPIPKTSSAFPAGSTRSPVALKPSSTAAKTTTSQTVTTKPAFGHVDTLTLTPTRSTSQIKSSAISQSTIFTGTQKPLSVITTKSPSITSASQTATTKATFGSLKPTPTRSTSQIKLSAESRSTIVAATQKPLSVITTKFPSNTSAGQTVTTKPLFGHIETVTPTSTRSTSQIKSSAESRTTVFEATPKPLSMITTKSPSAPSQVKPTQWSWSKPTQKPLSVITTKSPTSSGQVKSSQWSWSRPTQKPLAVITTKSPTASSQLKPTEWSWSKPAITTTSRSSSAFNASSRQSFGAIKSAPTSPARPVPTPTLKKSDVTSVRGSRLPIATAIKPWHTFSTSQQSASKSPLISIKSTDPRISIKSTQGSAPTRVSPGTSKPTPIFTSKPGSNQPSITRTATSTSTSTSTARSSRSTRSITDSSGSTLLAHPNSIIVTKPIQSKTGPSAASFKTSAVKLSPIPTTTKPRAIQITPTKPHRASGSLFSTKLNLYDFYFKLYGSYPPTKTSSTQPPATKTRQVNVVVASSRTS